MNHDTQGSVDATSASAANELATAIRGFGQDIKNLKGDIDMKIAQQNERFALLERKGSATRRSFLSHSAEGDVPHKKALNAYLRSGDDDGLRGLELEGKSLSAAVTADGGYLVDPQTAERVQSVLRGAASLRQVAKVVSVEAASFDVLVDHGDLGDGWASESGGVSETATPQIDRISIALHELSAMPKASQRLLDDSAFDLEGWLADRIAGKFARSEGAAFINGDGVDKPRGFLTYPTAAADAATWGQLAHVATGAAGDFDADFAADVLVDLVYALGAQYRPNATFVMNSKTAARVRKIKDADGRFLWSDSLANGQPSLLLGYPVLISEDMPNIADGANAIAFGDFSAGYTVAERPDLRLLRDPFSAKPHVLFYATKRVGGDVTDFNAIKVLKFAAG